MGGWSSDSKMEQRSPRRYNGRYDNSPWWGLIDPHHGLFLLKRLWAFETDAFPGKVLISGKCPLKGTQSWRMSEQMHPLSAESPTMSGFPGKKKRTKHRHIVSMFGPIMVRVTGFEPAASWSQTTRATNCATPGNRQKKLAPFRFRGLRKRHENSISAPSFFLAPIEPAALGFDGEGPQRKGWSDRGKGGKRSRPADSYNSIHHPAGGSKIFLGEAEQSPARPCHLPVAGKRYSWYNN